LSHQICSAQKGQAENQNAVVQYPIESGFLPPDAHSTQFDGVNWGT
jgi:hypothetical protein